MRVEIRTKETLSKIRLTLAALHHYHDILREQRLSKKLIRNSIDQLMIQTADAIAKVEIMDGRQRFAGENLELYYRDYKVLSSALQIYTRDLEGEMESFVGATGADNILYERMDDVKMLKSIMQGITTDRF